MEIIPAVDIKNGKCVRLTQGDFNKEKIYNNSPLSAAKMWENQGAKRLHLVDLDGAKDGDYKNLSEIKRIADNTSIPVQLGGGIRSYYVMKKYINMGIDKLIVSTIALKDQKLLKKALDDFGSERIIVSLDIKNGKIAIKGWLEIADESPEEILNKVIELGVKNIILTDISSDGMLSGPDIKMIEKLNKNGIDLIAAGGISSQKDLESLEKAGVEAAVVGKALYEGKLNL